MDKIFSYYDGNGNSYRLANQELSYSPIKPENSSSGYYDGGEPKKVTVSTADQKAIIDLLNDAISRPEIHQTRKSKGNSMISISGEGQMDRAILRWGSPEQTAIQELLTKILAQEN